MDRPPFEDVRVRQAFLLTIDYQALIEAFSDGFGRIDTLIPQVFEPWALPPAQWGPGAQFHSEPDLPEAKKLLEAAGLGGGFRTEIHKNASYSGSYVDSFLDAVAAMVREVDITMDVNAREYPLMQGMWGGQSEYDGMLDFPQGDFNDPDEYAFGFLHPGGRRYGSGHVDQKLFDMIEKSQEEIEFEARRELIWDIEKYNLVENYYSRTHSLAGWTLWQPWIKNYGPRPGSAGDQ